LAVEHAGEAAVREAITDAVKAAAPERWRYRMTIAVN
jgi:hypothetical protein